ncbi:hypothetical protein SADUNF_Sadunf06G0078700 [Salix dunnii]|uniref:Uncharacterized protein n=1 Tax=Salix dunnii TaxID=1413687 RepID=A0A835JYW0_9ROSI|nr:hypothetical protein SADUNF_Sadunf06G0078700 [Salix dunnii]
MELQLKIKKSRSMFLVLISIPWFSVILARDGIHFTHEWSKILVKMILKVIKEANRVALPEFSEDSSYDPKKTAIVFEPDLIGDFTWE